MFSDDEGVKQKKKRFFILLFFVFLAIIVLIILLKQKPKNTEITIQKYEYSLLYYSELGGDNIPESSIIYSAESSIVLPIESLMIPHLNGFTFIGYGESRESTSATYLYDYKNKSFSPSGVVLSSDCSMKVLYAIFLKNIPRIDGGDVANRQNLDESLPQTDTIIYNYILNYDFNNGAGAPTQKTVQSNNIQHNFSIDTTTIPLRPGYIFLGYANTNSAQTPDYVYNTVSGMFCPSDIIITANSASKTIYAVWSKIYTLAYDTNTGTNIPSTQSFVDTTIVTASHEFSIDTTTIPLRPGYIFLGYANTNSATTTDYAYNMANNEFIPSIITATINDSDRTLYSVWAVKTLSNITYMQDITPEICANTDMVAPNTGQYKLKDKRDNKEYYVAKLKDGNCWMTQNLALNVYKNSSILTSETTDLNTIDTYTPTLASSMNYGPSVRPFSGGTFTIDTRYDSISDCILPNTLRTEEYCTHYSIGNYYTWYTAVASNDTTSFADHSSASNSICPKGWKLPQSEYSVLKLDLNIVQALQAPYYFTRSGYYSAYNLNYSNSGLDAYYWTSNFNSSRYSIAFRIQGVVDSTSTTALYFYAEQNGSENYPPYLSIRCVAR